MSSLLELYIKKDHLETLLKGVNKKGDKGISLTLSVNDDTNEYGQNISAYVSQSKQQREDGVKKYYVGNGKVFWTDGKIEKAGQRVETVEAQIVSDEDDDLPF